MEAFVKTKHENHRYGCFSILILMAHNQGCELQYWDRSTEPKTSALDVPTIPTHEL